MKQWKKAFGITLCPLHDCIAKHHRARPSTSRLDTTGRLHTEVFTGIKSTERSRLRFGSSKALVPWLSHTLQQKRTSTSLFKAALLEKQYGTGPA